MRLNNCNEEQACQQAALLVDKFRQSSIRLPDGEDVKITISAGVSEHVADEKLLKTIQQADGHLYLAKHNGRNQVCSFKTELTN